MTPVAPGAAQAAPPSFTPLRHFVSVTDFTSDEIDEVLRVASALKEERARGAWRESLRGKSVAMVFQKPSLRTRVSFEVGLLELGGHGLYLSPAEIQLGQREGVTDAARVLSRYVQAIVARVFLHEDVDGLAQAATVPVINALSDREHPCQALADLLTLRERFGQLEGLTVAYVGDGNNVASSLALAAARVGLHFRAASPDGYEVPGSVLELATAGGTGAVELFRDPYEAVRGAHAVYTDTWYSMGQEDEAELREPAFRPYQVNAALVRQARTDAIVMHCLPAHRGQEITDEVLDGASSVVYEQAENRLHVQKALLLRLLGAG